MFFSENLGNINGSRIITSNNLNEEEDVLQNPEKSEKNIHEKNINVIEFNPEEGMEWKAIVYWRVL